MAEITNTTTGEYADVRDMTIQRRPGGKPYILYIDSRTWGRVPRSLPDKPAGVDQPEQSR